MNATDAKETNNEMAVSEASRDWERSEWFRKWMELIRPESQGSASR